MCSVLSSFSSIMLTLSVMTNIRFKSTAKHVVTSKRKQKEKPFKKDD